MRKIYIAGPMTGIKNFNRDAFFEAQAKYFPNDLVMNPAVLPAGFTHKEYMSICYPMVDACETVFFLNGWKDSKGAVLEHEYATIKGKTIIYAFN